MQNCSISYATTFHISQMCIKIRYKLIGNRFLWDVIYHPCLYLNGGLTVPRLMLMDWLFTTFKNVVCIYYLWMLKHRAWRRRIHSDGTSHIILQTHCFDNIFAGSTATTKLAICFTDISILYYYLWKHNMQKHMTIRCRLIKCRPQSVVLGNSHPSL